MGMVVVACRAARAAPLVVAKMRSTPETNEIRRQIWKPFQIPLSVFPNDRDAFAFYITVLAQAQQERFV